MYLPSGHGHVEVIAGPMYSGKTEELMRRLKREVIAGKRVMVFKPDIDDRYATEEIVTHEGESMHANSIPCSNSKHILEMVHPSVDAVGIDEGQFFDAGIIEVVEKLANAGKRVIVSGVDMDYRCLPFEPMNHLLSIAEIVDKLTAICFSCGRPATKIQRLTNGRLSIWDEPTVVVGSNISGQKHQYEARCRKCYKTPPKLISGGTKND
jgi:thymidine kinase